MVALTWVGLSAHASPCLVCRALQNTLQRLLCTMAVFLEVEGSTLARACYPVFILRLSATFLNEGTCPQAIYVGSYEMPTTEALPRHQSEDGESHPTWISCPQRWVA